jgi:hypothetical protein
MLHPLRLAASALVALCFWLPGPSWADPPPASGGLAVPDRGAGIDPETVARFQERNGPVFQGWAQPRAVIVFTGELDGYIEPCGCTGKENQKGGLSRRRNFLGAMAAADWPVVALDLGDQVNRFGRQTEIKFGSIVDGLKAMEYAAVGFGPKDLRLPAEEVVAAVSAVGDTPTPFVCANVGLIGFDSGITPVHRIVERGGLKIGITAVLGDAELADIRNDLIATKPAIESLVEPAVAELFTGEPAGAGDRLETRAESFLGVVGGSGVEVPAWLERLGVAVDRAIERAAAGIAAEPEGRLPEALPWAPLPWETLHAALAK